MRKFAPRAVHGLYAAAIAPLFFAMAATAATPADVSPALRNAMQRDLGMTSAQLSQYLKVEAQADRQEAQLARAQGASYAGSWIERGADGSFHFVVATTASGRKAPAGVQVRAVRHSLR